MIDWKRVADLRDEIGHDDFLDVAEMFLEEADQTIDQLAANPSAQEVSSLLHFLKGSALNLGLSDLASLCNEGEKLADSGQLEAFNPSHLAAVYAASRAAFLLGLPKDSAA